MAVEITAVHMTSGYNDYQHIEEVRWRNNSTGASNTSTRAQMVEWLQAGNSAYVADGTRQVQVQVVNATPPYIRTVADGRETNNLLALPRY